MINPFRCEPIYMKKVWGGRWLEEAFGRRLPDLEPYGESWELSCRPDAMSIVLTGEWKGRALGELIQMDPVNVLGQRLAHSGVSSLPLLVKYIDANDHLSIQVHPADAYAQRKSAGDTGKTEMWYVVDAEPEASLVFGLKKGISQEEFAECIVDERILQCVNIVPVKPGDAFYIPAGMVHAILKGVRLAEIQQNSDLTYRIYDWGRLGIDGTPRALHINDAMNVIDYSFNSGNALQGVWLAGDGYKRRLLVVCPYFVVEELEVCSLESRIPFQRFEVWMILEGQATLSTEQGDDLLTRGETWVIPAATGEYRVHGQVKILKTYIPDLETEVIRPLREQGCSERDIANLCRG